jgi:DNA-binding transcriptional LysR family regulator
MRQLALAGGGVVCLAAYMTSADVASGRLQTVMDPVLLDVRQPVSAVFYQSASMAGRAKAFLDFIAGRLVL